MKERLINIVNDLQKITENICTCKTLDELIDLRNKHLKISVWYSDYFNNTYCVSGKVQTQDFIIAFDMLTDNNDNINELNFKGKIEIYIPATHNYIKLPLFDLLDIERAKQYNYMF